MHLSAVVKGLIRSDQRSRCVGIDSYKFSLLSQHSYIHYILCKCMNQSFQKFTLIFMQCSIGKKIKKNKFEIRFPKAKTGFRFSINIPRCNPKYWEQEVKQKTA